MVAMGSSATSAAHLAVGAWQGGHHVKHFVKVESKATATGLLEATVTLLKVMF